MSQPDTQPRNIGSGRQILRVIAGLSLLYYAWMMIDLVTHPFSPGNNPGSVPYLFRWLSAIAGTFTVVVAVFIMRRVPNNINGLFLLFWGVAAAGWSLRIDFGSPTLTGLMRLGFGFYFLCVSCPAAVALIFHYPTGRIFPPRLTSWVWGLLAVGVMAGIVMVLGSPNIDPTLPNPFHIPAFLPYNTALTILIMVVLPFLALIFLGLRYRGAGMTERLQIKWLLWLTGLSMVVSILMTIISPVSFKGAINPSTIQIGKVMGFIYWQSFPAVAIGIALLRHRLWDIDLIIRRTLVYGVLSGVLALIYFGGVTLFQWFFTALSGQQSPASIVISTLLIAALFSPLRRRVQDFIDRRFYRPKYDGEYALARFSQTLRERIDLPSIESDLVRVVTETIQPVHAMLWIRPPEKK